MHPRLGWGHPEDSQKRRETYLPSGSVTDPMVSFDGAWVIRLTTQVTMNATGSPNNALEMLRMPNHSGISK